MRTNKLTKLFNTQTKVLLSIITLGLILVCTFSFIAINALKYEYDTNFTKHIQEIKILKDMQDFYSLNTGKKTDFKQIEKILAQHHNINTFDFLHNLYQKLFLHKSHDKLKNLTYEENKIFSLMQEQIKILGDLSANNLHSTQDKQINKQQAMAIHGSISKIIDLRLQIAALQKHTINSIFVFTSAVLFLSMLIVLLTTIFLSNHILKSIKQHEDELQEIIKEKTLQLENINANLQKMIKKEVELSRKKDQIMYQQDRLASMGEMIQNIAHQWRQPLNSLIILIQSFKTKFYNNKLDEQFINTQTEDGLKIAKSMSETIENFRHFFQPNKLKSLFSIIEAINDSIKLIEFVLKQNNITIHTTFQEDYEIYGYKNAFTQVVLNIIKNAQDAIIEQKIPQGHCHIALEKKYDKIIITIRDNAGGIKQKSLYKIFEPYFTTKHKSTGTGIGLYMTKEIIEKQMQGSISVTNTEWFLSSTPTQEKFYGASFIIELPCKQDKNKS